MSDLSKAVTRLAYHGTGNPVFTRFDLARVGMFNLGLHFGTRSAAESRIAYLREKDPAADFRILTCELMLENPLRVEDIFGHSYARIFEVLEREIGRTRARRKYDALFSRWMNADDNPCFQKDPSLYSAFNQHLNVELRRLFQELGYDGFVYTNEIESAESAADSYCVFDARQVSVVAEERVVKTQAA